MAEQDGGEGIQGVERLFSSGKKAPGRSWPWPGPGTRTWPVEHSLSNSMPSYHFFSATGICSLSPGKKAKKDFLVKEESEE